MTHPRQHLEELKHAVTIAKLKHKSDEEIRALELAVVRQVAYIERRLKRLNGVAYSQEFRSRQQGLT